VPDALGAGLTEDRLGPGMLQRSLSPGATMRPLLLPLLFALAGCVAVPLPPPPAPPSREPPSAPRPAPAPAPAPLPTDEHAAPAAALKPLGYFLGRWRCSVKPQPGTPTLPEFIWTLQPELRGAFLAGRVEPQVHPPESPWTRDTWGFNPTTGEFFRSFRDIEGGFGTVQSRGWEGDRLVFTGEAVLNGKRMAVRETIQRLGPDRLVALWVMRGPEGGDWELMSDEACARLP